LKVNPDNECLKPSFAGRSKSLPLVFIGLAEPDIGRVEKLFLAVTHPSFISRGTEITEASLPDIGLEGG
jgi:hypothetical protein